MLDDDVTRSLAICKHWRSVGGTVRCKIWEVAVSCKFLAYEIRVLEMLILLITCSLKIVISGPETCTVRR